MQQRTLPYLFLSLLLSFFTFSPAFAAEEGENTTKALPVYLELKPDFIVNYQSSGSRLKYIKSSITLRSTESSATAIQDNMPLVRDAIVMFMSQLTGEKVSGALAREQTRKDMLVELNRVLKEESGQEPVIDLLFASFVTQ